MNHPQILYVCPNAYRGGAEKFVLDNVKLHMAAGDFLVHVLFFSDGPICQEIRDLGGHCTVLPFKLRFSRPWTYLRAIYFVFRMILGHKFNLVHSTMAYAHLVVGPAALFSGIPEIWFQHGPVGSYWDILGKLIPSRKILFNSPFLLEKHNELFGPNFEEDELIVPLGVSISPTTDLCREDFTNSSSEKILLWVGRMASGKGLHLAVEALSHMDRELPWHFVAVGDPSGPEDQKYLNSVLKRVEELGLEKRVSIRHDQKDMSRFYNISDVLIHSAVIPESFGLVVAEAMGHAKFVIASSRGGVAKLIGKNERGIVYDSFSKEAPLILAGIITQYLEKGFVDEANIRESAREYILKHHSYQIMNKSLEDLYHSILD